MKKVEITVYITTDGKKFFEKEKAEKHEKSICNTKAYKTRYAPDLTETEYLTKVACITNTWKLVIYIMVRHSMAGA